MKETTLEKEFERGWKGSTIVQACKIETRIKVEEERAYNSQTDPFHRGVRRGLELALKIVKSGK